MSWDYLTLILILGISVLGHNNSVAFASGILLVLKLVGLDALFPAIESHGLNWGIIILTIAILVPVANGSITLPTMMESFKTPLGIIAIFAGIFAAVSGGLGVQMLKSSPEIVSALIIGTIVGVFFFKGVAVGPLIAGGIVYIAFTLKNLFH